MSKPCRFGVGALVAVLLSTGGVLAGDLTPPGPPAPTMRTLQEIYDKLEEIDGKVEGGATYEAAAPQTGQTTSYRTGDDGDLEKGVAWPDPRFTDHEDGTVTDNLTGLMWTQNADLDGTKNWNNAIDFCNGLDYAGHSDWRLPNVRELLSLIDYGRSSPALPSGHLFTSVASAGYWSSSTSAGSTVVKWSVSLGDGAVNGVNQVGSYRVWPVRAGQ